MFQANTTARCVLFVVALLIVSSAGVTTVTAQDNVIDPRFDLGDTNINVGDTITLDAGTTQIYEDQLESVVGVPGFSYSSDYTWSVTEPDGTTTSGDALDGETTTYTFSQEGDYQITLEVTVTWTYLGQSASFSDSGIQNVTVVSDDGSSAVSQYDVDGDGIETGELQTAIQDFLSGSVSTAGLQAIIQSFLSAGI
jgi:hypothetical protein